MSSTIRSRVAAALLLSPFAVLLASPALADHREPQPAVVANGGYGYSGDYGDHRRGGWRRDDRAPRIMDLTPQPGDVAGGRRFTRVSARFFDRASGVDPASVRLRINGQDVTGRARVFQDEVRYRDALLPGRYVAELVVRDRAGNLARRSWQFDVAGRHERFGYGYGRDWRRD